MLDHPFKVSFDADDHQPCDLNEQAESSRPVSTETESHVSELRNISIATGVDSDIGPDAANPSKGPSEDPNHLRRRTAKELPRKLLWILAVFENRKREHIYAHLNALQLTTDYTLFCGLRQKYFRLSSWWRRFISLREVTAIRFVRVRKPNANSHLRSGQY